MSPGGIVPFFWTNLFYKSNFCIFRHFSSFFSFFLVELINLLDYAIHIRNVSFFILVLFYLERSSVSLTYIHTEKETKKITGPWRNAINYVLGQGDAGNSHYESIFSKQFFDLNQHKNMPLNDFVEVLCDNFTKYQRYTDDGQYQIIPREKQKDFLKKIVRAEECFHFSEVGSGKTKVILPLLCQLFLSNNKEAHGHFARGGGKKHTLIVLVPEHLVKDAKTQVFKYCLNLNFRERYKVYDDIFALLHREVDFQEGRRGRLKQIFVTSFNQFKKALTYESICQKVWPAREQILVVSCFYCFYLLLLFNRMCEQLGMVHTIEMTLSFFFPLHFKKNLGDGRSG